MICPDVNQFNLDEDGDEDDADYEDCVNTPCGGEEDGFEDSDN